jgi:exodeoxyribonuclease V gamma subunit
VLQVHHSNRLEVLADKLCELLASPAGPPLEAETVVVQSTGMARWLALRVAASMGVAANLRFPFPAAYLWEAYQKVLDDDLPAPRSKFRPGVMTWRLMHLLPQMTEEPGFETVRSYLRAGDELARFELASRIADSYDAYLVYRPDWIAAWEQGPGKDAPWQARLWPALRAGLDEHRVDLQRRFLERLRSIPGPLARLPARSAVFGISTMPPAYLQAIEALAAHQDLHLFVLNPCREYWGDIVSERERSRRALGVDASAAYLAVGHPLLASTGRQGRDFLEMVAQLEGVREECFEEPEGDALLSRLQRGILDLREPSSLPFKGRSDGLPDLSFQVHVSHGKLREIEILHDQLMRLFQADPALAPGSVVVMTPDIDDYQPYIEAVFRARSGRHHIPYTVADRTPLSESLLLAAVFALFDLVDGRLECDRVMALLDHACIRRRLEVDEVQAEQLREWAGELQVHWAMDAEERQQLGLPQLSAGTWRSALDRLLLGLAVGSEALPSRPELPPFVGVGDTDGDLVGRFHELVMNAQALRQALAGRHAPTTWRDLLTATLDRVVTPAAAEESEFQVLHGALAEFAEDAAVAGFDGMVGFRSVRGALARLLAGKQRQGRFLAGSVSFCAMVPMRSVPFECVCLIGMNDGSYPRRHSVPGFDLMASDRRRGDRSRREDDRYLFLEAILSARRYLYLSYVGRSPRDDSEIPPSPLLTELLELVDAHAVAVDCGPHPVRIRHPLQAFSPRYFRAEPGLVSYSEELAAAVTQVGQQQVPPALVRPPLPPPGEEPGDGLSLEALIDFLANPPRHLLRQHLAIELGQRHRVLESSEPFWLDGLGAYRLRQRMCELIPKGLAGEALRQHLEAEGLLPLGAPGKLRFAAELAKVEGLLARLADAGGDGAAPALMDLVCEQAGFRLQGRITLGRDGGHLAWRPGRVRAEDRLAAWVRHLALALAVPSSRRGRTRLLGIAPDEDLLFLPVVDPARHLGGLLALYRRGRRQPIAWLPAPGEAYLNALAKGHSEAEALAAAAREWNGNERHKVPGPDAYARLLLGSQLQLDGEFAELTLGILTPLRAHIGDGARG